MIRDRWLQGCWLGLLVLVGAAPVPLVASTMLESVGTVSSCVTTLLSVVAVTATPALPAASENPRLNTIAPSASLS